jgi:hypothetical protein
MRQLSLPFYTPTAIAPERAVLTVLAAALHVARVALHDEHPALVHAPHLGQAHAPLVVASARLLADRCAELLCLLDFYDAALDAVLSEVEHDGADIPF